MKKILFLFAFICSSIAIAQDSFQEDMKHFLNMNGTVHYYENVVDRMFDFLKQEYAEQKVPENVWADLNDEVKTEAIDEITELITQSYQGHFTNEELVRMLNFYKTTTGKKVLLKEPIGPEEVKERDAFYESELGQKISVSTESLNNILKQLTQEWSAQLFRDASHKLEEKGFKKQG